MILKKNLYILRLNIYNTGDVGISLVVSTPMGVNYVVIGFNM